MSILSLICKNSVLNIRNNPIPEGVRRELILIHMKQPSYALFNGEKYLVIAEKGNYVTICNGEYSHLGENAITVKREEVTFL